MGEIISPEKVRHRSKYVARDYVNSPVDTPDYTLWKTPVENSVEIVEKFRFSTIPLADAKSVHSWGSE